MAHAAGVSTATVSRVLTRSGTVSASLSARVTAVVAELGYTPNVAARSLSLGHLGNVGILMPSMTNPYFYDVVEQVGIGASAAGFRLLLADTGGDPHREEQAVADLRPQVDGLILLSSRISNAGLRRLGDKGEPIVLVNRLESGVGLPAIAVDNFTPTLDLCGHLLELGHTEVAYLSGPSLSWQDRERWRAVETARRLGLAATRIEGDGSLETAADAVEDLLATGASAIVCFNDLSAVSVMTRLGDLGVRVPDDISVTGFDDIPLTRHVRPALTTVRSPTSVVGSGAWKLLQARLHSPETPEPVIVTADLVIRDSTSTPGR
ncbi:LacI family transcriptional regulator [Subtercola sp. Z020]|nr:LacI family DNA-binding transcriptional regulator [Subtercola sp. Z020]PPF77511.1 LacI family transcriptional regulator [Subtercola sp. Z020]